MPDSVIVILIGIYIDMEYGTIRAGSLESGQP